MTTAIWYSHLQRTRRSSSANLATRCCRSHTPTREPDWGGPSRLRSLSPPALIERRIAAVLRAVPRVDRAPASAGPRRLAPLRARPALGVSVGEQQSHYCDAEQNKTDRAHDGPPTCPPACGLRSSAAFPNRP